METGLPVIARPVSGERESATFPPLDYHLDVVLSPLRTPIIYVHDRRRNDTLLEWHGNVARHLIECGALPTQYQASGRYQCDKHLVQHLALAAASTSMALERVAWMKTDVGTLPPKALYARPSRISLERAGGDAYSPAPTLLWWRLRRLGRRLTKLHERIANVLFARPGWHYAHDDVVCTLALCLPVVGRRRVEQHLDDLVRWLVIQRIVVDTNNVFYDIDTTPHLHVFDARSRELHDAPEAGVLRVAKATG